MSERTEGVGESWDPVEERQARDRLVATLFGRETPLPALSRYRLGDKLGEGGNGVVYRAHDPELDRDVAIKLVRVRPGSGGAEELARLEREAQALARLSHPNVVEIFDVGRYEAEGSIGVFLVMALVEGTTLDAWLEPERSAGEISDVMRQAADGLLAAHAVGLVHRDFKPTNVMIDEHGRVRVLDFGLARQLGDTSRADTNPGSGSVVVSTDERLTGTGLVVGTPAYMAPEQITGGEVDARSDQYSFCATLYQCFEGRRPFVSSSDRAPGEPVPPMERKDVPRRVAAAIVRGLEWDPEDRFDDFGEVREALSEGRRAAWPWVAVGVVAIGSAAAIVTTRDEETPEPRCARGLGGTWNGGARSELAGAFARTDDVAALWPSVERGVDTFATAWGKIEAANCSPAGGGDAELFDLTVRCLEDRERALGALLEVLQSGDSSVLERAPRAVAELPPVSRCQDERLLRAHYERPPAEMASRLDALGDEMAKVRALQQAGRIPESLELARKVTEQAHEIGFAPTIARVDRMLGRVLTDAGEYEEATTVLSRAYSGAIRTHQDDIAADAARENAFVLGYFMAREEEGKEWVRHAQAAIANVEDPGATEAFIHTAHAAILIRAGNVADAVEQQRKSIAIAERVYGPNHRQVGGQLDNLAGSLAQLGRLEEATEVAQRALRINEAQAGPRNPATAASHYNLGALSQLQGDFEAAREHYETALSIREEKLGKNHPDIAGLMNNLGSVYGDLGRTEDAIAAFGRAIEVWTAAHGTDFPDLAKPLNNMGREYRNAKRYDEALATYAKALALLEQAYGPDHPDIGFTLLGMGDVHSDLEQFGQAVPLYERCLTIWTASQMRGAELASLRFALARALWASPAQRSRALELARAAEQTFAEDPGHADQLENVRTWLAQR